MGGGGRLGRANEFKLKKWDLLHLIPFFLFFINHLPFYTLPTAEKMLIIKGAILDWSNAYKVKTGLMPEYINYLLRPLQASIYLIFHQIFASGYAARDKLF